jgi:MFS family permease
MLGVLLVIMAFNYVDRQALGLLLQDIKVDLSLSDTQLGLMSGIAFALFYSVLGIPIARWADRGNRVFIIAISAALACAAVVLCGVAQNFEQLLLIRIAVGVGEAGCVPPAMSLIADYFSRADRPKAVAIYKLGLPLSLVVGFFIAGWLNELFGWRTTFALLGLPGLVLAVLAALTLREPRREKWAIAAGDRPGANTTLNRESGTAASTEPSLKEVFLTLWSNTTFRHLLFGYSVIIFFNSGIGQWTPTFFKRSYGLQTGELGTWFAIIFGLGGFAGTYLGGVLASRYAAHNESLQLKATAAIYASCAPIAACIFLSSSHQQAFAVMGLIAVVGGTIIGPLFATVQTLVPERMRAMSIAILFLFANLIGMGLAPLVVGMLSDAFHHWASQESLRYALLALCPGYFWAGWHLWRASRTVARDLDALHGDFSQPVRQQNEAAVIGGGFHRMSAKPIPPQ